MPRGAPPVARLVVAAVVVLGGLLAATPASAQEDAPGEAVMGQLRADGEGVGGVALTVQDQAGAEVGGATSAQDGTWQVILPGPGTFVVTIDPTTLPEGVRLSDPTSLTRELPVGAGQDRIVLFGLTRGTPTTPTTGDGAEGDDQGGADGGDGATGGGITGEGSTSPGSGAGGTGFSSDRLAQAALNGLKFGLIIAMAAIGLSLIFGTTGLINFAHAELVTFGAVAAWYLNTGGPTLHVVVAGAIAVVITALIGGALERGLWRPLRHRRTGLFQMLVITIGLSLLARHVILLFFEGRSKPYIDYRVQSALTWGPVRLTPRDLVVMLASVAVLVLVATVLQRSRLGKATRAVADNLDLAESSGIDVQRIILLVWMVGAGLAATGGIFLGMVTSVSWNMGFQLLLLMFAAIILGGLGNAYGAMAGGLVVGLVTEISTVWVSSELKTAFALLVLIVVLLFKPQGILGARERIG